MSIMTVDQFRTLAGLTLTTREGTKIKAVQTALGNYHKKAGTIKSLNEAVNEWFGHHEDDTKLGDSRKALKKKAMEKLRSQIQALLGVQNTGMTIPPMARVQQQAARSRDVNEKKISYEWNETIGGRNFSVRTKYSFSTIIAGNSPEVIVKIPIYVAENVGKAEEIWAEKYDLAGIRTCTWASGGVNGQLRIVAPVPPATLQGWSGKIRESWNSIGAKLIPRPGTVGAPPRPISLKFDVQFVNDINDGGIRCFCTEPLDAAANATNPTGTVDALRWGRNDTDLSTWGAICHEVGHCIGFPDEYGTVGFTDDWGGGPANLSKNWDSPHLPQIHKGLMNCNTPPIFARYLVPLARRVCDELNYNLASTEVVVFLPPTAINPKPENKARLDVNIWNGIP